MYTARILVKMNQGYPKMADDLTSLQAQLDKEKNKLAVTNSAAEKTKQKVVVEDMTTKVAAQKVLVDKANVQIDRAFVEYNNVLKMKPNDKSVLSEMAANYNLFRRYDMVAKTLTKMIDPSKDNTDDFMKIGRAYYNGGKYKTADSIFSSISAKSPEYVPAYLWTANTYSKMDPDVKLGLAKPKFEKLISIAKTDSIKNATTLMDAFGYMSYYNMKNNNFGKSKEYYNRMINLDPNNKENRIRGYNGIASVEMASIVNEKTNEGRLPYLSRATEAYNKILALDPNNATAKTQINYIHEFEASIKKGINPNEIKGTVKNSTGAPLAYASIRVKDTAAENLSNAKGEFRFEIPQGSAILIFSAQGYKSVEVPITASRTYNVTLEQ
jgi:tetratricopeptide (TPR) repeat protein